MTYRNKQSVLQNFMNSASGKIVIGLTGTAVIAMAVFVDQNLKDYDPETKNKVVAFDAEPNPESQFNHLNETELPSVDVSLPMPEAFDGFQTSASDDGNQRVVYENALREKPNNVTVRFKLAQLLNSEGEQSEAAEHFELLTKIPQLAADSWYELARIAAQRNNVARVVLCLRKAEAAGFHDLVGMLADPSFAALRSNPEFYRLQQHQPELPGESAVNNRVSYRLGTGAGAI